jgi:hypothetical protein
VEFFDVTPEECIERDLKRPNSVGSKVIWQMYNQYLKPPPAAYHPPEDMPPAIICDIDGTLAHMHNRSPYEWNKVGEDIYDDAVGTILKRFKPGYHIILLSGRDGVCETETIEWLKRYDVPYDQLFMRWPGNMEKDTVIKKRMFEEYIREQYQVEFVLDDRNSVVKMWRDEIGLKVLQVEDGDF